MARTSGGRPEFCSKQVEGVYTISLYAHLTLFIDYLLLSLLVRWDPSRETDIFFDQACMLQAHYYYVQIVIHRPFASQSGNPSSLKLPALAICTNAARAASNILDVQQRRSGKFLAFQVVSDILMRYRPFSNVESTVSHRCPRLQQQSCYC
jgi:hypothetical protein